jgi:CBS domain containing-hemolysin-like protein
MVALLLAVCLLTGVISFLCSLTEAVLLSLNPLSLQVKSTRGEKHAAKWLALKQNVERPLSAILVFNTLANTGLATLAGALFAYTFGSHWLWAFTIIFSGFIIFGGELAPKIIGVHHAERIAPHLITPLTWILRAAHPLAAVMDKFCQKLKGRPSASSSAGSDRIMDIVTLVEAARAEQVLHNREEIIIIHAATLSARRIRTSMVPLESVACFDARRTLLENIRALGAKLHRSYPVSADGTLDTVTGYIRVRELFVQNLTAESPASAPDWHSLIRPVLHINERATLTQLLALFLDRSEIAALVDNKDGRVSGWITMDDVMKVLMGQRV